MAIGTATPASRVRVGETIGAYKGGKFNYIGLVESVTDRGDTLLIHLWGQRVPHSFRPRTVVRVVIPIV